MKYCITRSLLIFILILTTSSIGHAFWNNLKSIPDAELCKDATRLSGGKVEWTPSPHYSKHIREAKKRGLSCGTNVQIETNNTDPEVVLKEVFYSFAPNSRKKLQRHLQTKGYYNGLIDGVWGRKTKNALVRSLANKTNISSKNLVKKELNKILSAIPTASSSYSGNSSNLSESALCKKATFMDGPIKKWAVNSAWIKFVNQAKDQGLSCGVNSNEVAGSGSSSSSSWLNTYQNKSSNSINSSNSSSSSSWVNTYQNKSNKTANNQKKKNILLLGILGAAAIASGNGDANTTGFLLGLGCGVTADNEPCDNATRRDDDGFKWGVNYRKVGQRIKGPNGSFRRIGSTHLYRRDDGVGFSLIGDTLYGDDGTTCRQVGSFTRCN